MNVSRPWAVLLALGGLALGFVHPELVQAEDAAQPAEASFSKEQLEQMVAPIALYPDSLLSQVLMASTYPLEIVEAQRWVGQNSSLKDDELDKAMLDKSWDPSIKALCHLPDVLTKMSDNLDWTQDLGDAFLGQKQEVMDTVQRMRNLAYEAGNLKTTEQQVVTQQPNEMIVIESPQPQVVYVPSYSPTVVYGSAWSYPSYYYPPMYAPYPPGYGLMTFGFGMAMGAAIWGDCDWDGGWGNSDVDIDIDNYNEFNRNTNRNWEQNNISRGEGGRGNWQHNPEHRKGVGYRDRGTAQQFGARGGSNRVSRDQARGWSDSRAGNRAGAGAGNRAGVADRSRAPGAGSRPSAGTSNRPGASTRPSGGANRPSASTRPSTASRPSTSGRPSASTRQSGSSNRSGSRDTALSGSRSPSRDRAASSRGASSRGMSSGGGRSFGGGGRSGGGGGRRR
jgi:hypothetical protein